MRITVTILDHTDRDELARAIDFLNMLNGDAPAAPFGVNGLTDKVANFYNDKPADTAVDSKGTPWDERIHAGSKTTTKSGEWTKRRGLPDGEYERVMAEITVPTEGERLDNEQNDDLCPTAPPAPPAPPEAATTVPTVTTFAELAKALAAGEIDRVKFENALSVMGIENMPALAKAPENIPAIMELLSQW